MQPSLEQQVTDCLLNIGFGVRKAVNSLPRNKRSDRISSILKPHLGGKAYLADVVGEQTGFDNLSMLSNALSIPIVVIVDPKTEQVHEIGKFSGSEIMYAYFDAVDGTIKLTGLGNDPEKGIYRVGNNGCWGAGIALTYPTRKTIRDLVMGDFKMSAIVDGNPPKYRVYPTNAFCFPDSSGTLKTFERDEETGEVHELSMSTQTNLSQAVIIYDSFQAFDRNSAPRELEALASKIFEALNNRNEGGAFDIVRMYGTAGEHLRELLERKGSYEPWGVGKVTLNEHLANIIPTVPIVYGANGQVVDFYGQSLLNRHLTAERPNVIIAANETILNALFMRIGQVISISGISSRSYLDLMKQKDV